MSDLTQPKDDALNLRVRGEVRFRHAAGSGLFQVEGILNAVSRQLSFRPHRWIEQPEGFIAVTLDGTLSEDGTR